MTWTQFARLWNDYGAFVTICVVVAIVVVTGLSLLVKFWPVLTKSVTIGTALATLPTELGDLRGDVTTLQGHVSNLTRNLGDLTRNLGDVTTNLGDVTTNLGDVTIKLASNGQAFVEHLDDAKAKTTILMGLDARLDSIEEKAGIAAHQTTNNGGGSLKDAADRTELTTTRLEALMRELIGKVAATPSGTTDHSGVTNNFGMQAAPPTAPTTITP